MSTTFESPLRRSALPLVHLRQAPRRLSLALRLRVGENPMGKQEERAEIPFPRANRVDPLIRPIAKPSPVDQLQVATAKLFKRMRDRFSLRPTQRHLLIAVFVVSGLSATAAIAFTVGADIKASSLGRRDFAASSQPPLGTLPLIASAATSLRQREAESSAGPSSRSLGPTQSTLPANSSQTSIATIAVHAAGAVESPAVYNLPAGARVDDVISAAGGLGPDADPDAINLAAHVGDGERVFVPRRGHQVPPVQTGTSAVGERTEGAAGAVAGAAPKKVIDLNTASVEELDTLPGIGPATAAKIIAYRTRVGRFRSVAQLLEVRGIGAAKLALLRARLLV